MADEAGSSVLCLRLVRPSPSRDAALRDRAAPRRPQAVSRRLRDRAYRMHAAVTAVPKVADAARGGGTRPRDCHNQAVRCAWL
jgi:hypothetical protein